MNLNIHGGEDASIPLQHQIQPQARETADLVGPDIEEAPVVRERAVEEKTLRFEGADLKLPTMSLVAKALQGEGLDYTHVKGFSSSLPESNGALQLEPFELNGKTCFQGKMTFSVTAERDDGSSIILKFTQTIKTAVEIPFSGGADETNAAMTMARVKLEGYRQHIGEPLIDETNKATRKVAAEALQKSSFTITTTPESIQRSISRESSSSRTAQSVSSVFSLTIEGKEKPLEMETLWTKKLECSAVNERNEALNEVSRLTAEGKPTKPELLSKYGLNVNTALNIVARDTLSKMKDLQTDLAATKQKIDEHLEQSKSCREKISTINNQLTNLPTDPRTEPPVAQVRKDLNEQKSVLLKEANKHLEEAKSAYKELSDSKKDIESKTSALKNYIFSDPKINEALGEIKTIGDSLSLDQTINQIGKNIKAADRPTPPDRPFLRQEAVSIPIPEMPTDEEHNASIAAMDSIFSELGEKFSEKDKLAMEALDDLLSGKEQYYTPKISEEDKKAMDDMGALLNEFVEQSKPKPPPADLPPTMESHPQSQAPSATLERVGKVAADQPKEVFSQKARLTAEPLSEGTFEVAFAEDVKKPGSSKENLINELSEKKTNLLNKSTAEIDTSIASLEQERSNLIDGFLNSVNRPISTIINEKTSELNQLSKFKESFIKEQGRKIGELEEKTLTLVDEEREANPKTEEEKEQHRKLRDDVRTEIALIKKSTTERSIEFNEKIETAQKEIITLKELEENSTLINKNNKKSTEKEKQFLSDISKKGAEINQLLEKKSALVKAHEEYKNNLKSRDENSLSNELLNTYADELLESRPTEVQEKTPPAAHEMIASRIFSFAKEVSETAGDELSNTELSNAQKLLLGLSETDDQLRKKALTSASDQIWNLIEHYEAEGNSKAEKKAREIYYEVTSAQMMDSTTYATTTASFKPLNEKKVLVMDSKSEPKTRSAVRNSLKPSSPAEGKKTPRISVSTKRKDRVSSLTGDVFGKAARKISSTKPQKTGG